MRPTRLYTQLLAAYALIVAGMLAAALVLVTQIAARQYLDTLTSTLAAHARVLDQVINFPLTADGFSEINAWCETVGRITDSRVTVVTESGRVAGDSEGDANTMANHGDRPEILDALAGRTGRHIRFSDTLQKDMIYIAVPLNVGGATAGAIRMAVPSTALTAIKRQSLRRAAPVAACIALVASVLAWAIARRIAKPFEALSRRVAENTEDSVALRYHPGGATEARDLADAIERMTTHHEDRVQSLLRQHNELQAIVSSMGEGVLAVDRDGRVLNLNRAASDMLRAAPASAPGRALREVVRNPELDEFVEQVLTVGHPFEREVVLFEDEERHLRLHGAPINDARGMRIGAVIVLGDMTHVRRLERVRRDFVANVSHEIRTPVTSIKGYVETLLDGAMDEPQSCRRFLEIVARQADRLIEIIHDLLTLAQVEQEARSGIARDRAMLCSVLESAVSGCTARAVARDMHIDLRCLPDLEARVNAPMMEQAVVNLLNNAIAYSDSGDTIIVEAVADSGMLTICVTDHGPGVAREHLPRLFERFYRVDKARSRQLGGTGLGLAIVKHIVQSHDGHVGVESRPGKGSTFTICVPLD